MSVKRGLAVAGGVIAGLVAVAVLVSTVFEPKSAPPRPPLIPASVQEQLHFTLYYPQGLPAGMSVQTRTFKVPQANVLVFGVKDGSRQIAVSEQPKPPATFDLNGFHTNTVANSSQFLTREGQATQGQLSDGRQFADLITVDTWIIVTAPSQVSADDLHAVVASMTVYRGG